MTRVKRDSIGYIVVIGTCILFLTWAIPTYTPEYPGYGAPPALVPNVAVSVVLVMACVSLIQAILSTVLKKPLPEEEREFPEDIEGNDGFTQVGRVNLKHLASIMVPAVLLLVAIEYIGYAPASFLFLMAIQYLIGSRRWLQSAIVAVILVAALYIIMRYGFGVPVPGPQLFE